MSSMLTVSFGSPRPEVAGAFWAALLGREAVDEPAGVLLPGTATQIGLRFVRSTSAKLGANRLHLHVTSESADDQRRIVRTALERGGRRRGAGPLPYGRILYLSDPDSDEFCLIEPGSRYLAGCGPLGEVTCDGSPEAARFWGDVLGWAVVWDRDGQIAIQSPEGGTKLGWDRWPAPTPRARARQRFELTASELDDEIRRLVALGATLRGVGDGVATLADPDGEVFAVRATLA